MAAKYKCIMLSFWYLDKNIEFSCCALTTRQFFLSLVILCLKIIVILMIGCFRCKDLVLSRSEWSDAVVEFGWNMSVCEAQKDDIDYNDGVNNTDQDSGL